MRLRSFLPWLGFLCLAFVATGTHLPHVSFAHSSLCSFLLTLTALVPCSPWVGYVSTGILTALGFYSYRRRQVPAQALTPVPVPVQSVPIDPVPVPVQSALTDPVCAPLILGFSQLQALGCYSACASPCVQFSKDLLLKQVCTHAAQAYVVIQMAPRYYGPNTYYAQGIIRRTNLPGGVHLDDTGKLYVFVPGDTRYQQYQVRQNRQLMWIPSPRPGCCLILPLPRGQAITSANARQLACVRVWKQLLTPFDQRRFINPLEFGQILRGQVADVVAGLTPSEVYQMTTSQLRERTLQHNPDLCNYPFPYLLAHMDYLIELLARLQDITNPSVQNKRELLEKISHY